MRSPALSRMIVTAVLVICFEGVGAASEVRAGVAKAWFTVPKRVPLAGYSRRHGRPSSGVHDPVGVRALVATDADTTAALVSCDVLIIDEDLFEAVRRRAIARGLPQHLVLVLAATHTHSGPGAYGKKFLEKLSMGHFDPQVFDLLAQTMTEVIVQAYARRRPCRLASGADRIEGLVENRMTPGGLVDNELLVSAFYQERAEAPFAVLVNFAAHPTTLGAWNTELSADYPGVVMEEIERRFPDATCLFFAGSVGDQAPHKAGDRFERAQRIGRPLAQQAIRLVEAMQPALPDAVHAIQEPMRLPPAQIRLGRLRLPRWLGQPLVDDDATLSVLTVGPAAFIGVPCDLTASLGAVLKQAARSHRLSPMVIGFASDYIGYCVPGSLYQAQQYESSMAFNGPRAGELVVSRLEQMLDQIVVSGK